MLHDLCVGKTGCLTKGDLKVKKFQICKLMDAKENNRRDYPDTFNLTLEMPNELKDIIKESILSNSDVRIECNDATC